MHFIVSILIYPYPVTFFPFPLNFIPTCQSEFMPVQKSPFDPTATINSSLGMVGTFSTHDTMLKGTASAIYLYTSLYGYLSVAVMHWWLRLCHNWMAVFPGTFPCLLGLTGFFLYHLWCALESGICDIDVPFGDEGLTVIYSHILRVTVTHSFSFYWK